MSRLSSFTQRAGRLAGDVVLTTPKIDLARYIQATGGRYLNEENAHLKAFSNRTTQNMFGVRLYETGQAAYGAIDEVASVNEKIIVTRETSPTSQPTLFVSDNGSVWSEPINLPERFFKVLYQNATYVAAGAYGIYTSDDLIVWEKVITFATHPISHFTFFDNAYFFILNKEVHATTNLVSHAKVPALVDASATEANRLILGNNRLVVFWNGKISSATTLTDQTFHVADETVLAGENLVTMLNIIQVTTPTGYSRSSDGVTWTAIKSDDRFNASYGEIDIFNFATANGYDLIFNHLREDEIRFNLPTSSQSVRVFKNNQIWGIYDKNGFVYVGQLTELNSSSFAMPLTKKDILGKRVTCNILA